MDINKVIADMKRLPGFAEKVGMVLIHNGTVRELTQLGQGKISFLDVNPDYKKLDALQREYEEKEGIFRIVVEARSGRLAPGDDLLLIAVAGDIRERVLTVMSELLERIKTEAVRKQEI